MLEGAEKWIITISDTLHQHFLFDFVIESITAALSFVILFP